MHCLSQGAQGAPVCMRAFDAAEVAPFDVWYFEQALHHDRHDIYRCHPVALDEIDRELGDESLHQHERRTLKQNDAEHS